MTGVTANEMIVQELDDNGALKREHKLPFSYGAVMPSFRGLGAAAAVAANIAAEITGKPADAEATWNAICLADFGDTGAAFVALPQIPLRNVTWSKKCKWVHLAKIAFDKYFMRKGTHRVAAPVYETYVLKAVGITSLKSHTS